MFENGLLHPCVYVHVYGRVGAHVRTPVPTGLACSHGCTPWPPGGLALINEGFMRKTPQR